MLNGEVDSEVAAKWVIQLVNVVHHIHSNNLFHHLVTPRYVMVTDEDNILLGGLDMVIEGNKSDIKCVGPNYSPESN